MRIEDHVSNVALAIRWLSISLFFGTLGMLLVEVKKAGYMSDPPYLLCIVLLLALYCGRIAKYVTGPIYRRGNSGES